MFVSLSLQRRLALLPVALLSAALLSACTPQDPTESHVGEIPDDTSVAETGMITEAGHAGDPEEGIVELTPESAAGASIRLAAAEQRLIGRQLETTGQVGFDEDQLAHVGPRIPGRVDRVLTSLGEAVVAGQELAIIDSIELGRSKAEYLQTRARHELSLEILEREETLYADRITSEQNVLVARAAMREAAAARATAKETLNLYGLSRKEVDSLRYDDPSASLLAVRAPFAGRVVERHVTRGELVAPGTNLFTIAGLSQVWVWIDVFERDLANVHLDDDVEVRVDTYPGEVFLGKVTYIAHQVEAETRSIRARLDVPNPDGRLRSGMFARIQLTDPHSVAGDPEGPSTVVPVAAVQRDGQESVVFVARGEFRFERREVTPGRTAGGWIELLEGLEPGEQVVVEGAFLLKSEAAKGEMGAGHAH